MKPIECTGAAFRGLKNPYTGEPMKVMMVVRTGGDPLFFAPDTYDTGRRAHSSREAYDLWTRVDGIGGRRTDVPPKCAYTGESLTYASDADGAWFNGGFNPTRLHTRDEFLTKARMRNGRSTDPIPTPMSSRATPVKDEPKVKSHEKDISQTAVELAGETVSKIKKARK